MEDNSLYFVYHTLISKSILSVLIHYCIQLFLSHIKRIQSACALLPSDLMYTDVALVAEHHLIVVLPVRGLANVTHHVLVVLNAQSFFRLHGMRHVVVAAVLELLHHPLHGDLIQRWHGWEQQSEAFLICSSQTMCICCCHYCFY